ncbi:MAG: hypothetical protein MUE50_18800, partial [Pirellulaceae bacterium]|nr:hypothetical protein [Pirellulaceae bacterium]
MKPMPHTVMLCVLLSFAVVGARARGGEPPRLLYLPGYKTPVQEAEPPPAVPGYIKQGTWHESLRASLQAAFGSTDATDAAARAAEYPQLRDALWDLVA